MTISWHETRERMRADKHRLISYYERSPTGPPLVLLLQASYACVFLHRISHYFFENNNRLLARLIWHLNLLFTGADISPLSNISGGMIIHYPLCVVIVGRIGVNCTIEGHGGLGGGRDSKDIGAGPGLPVIGDNVYMAMGSFVLGSVIIGNGSYIGARCYVTKDVEENGSVSMVSPKKRTVKPKNKASDQ